MRSNRKRGRPRHNDILTPAEWKTVHLAQHGLSNRQIAHRRGVSVDAVKFHIANVLLKTGLESKQALRGWFVAPRHSALRSRSGKMSDTNDTLGPIGQVSRSVSDLSRSVAWYRDVLELKHLYTFGNLAFFDCGGARLFLEEREDGATAESVVYFRVDDIGAVHARLSAREVRFSSAPHIIHVHDDGTEEWMAFFDDPDGRPLAIMSQVK